jgi:hypothetical protein
VCFWACRSLASSLRILLQRRGIYDYEGTVLRPNAWDDEYDTAPSGSP